MLKELLNNNSKAHDLTGVIKKQGMESGLSAPRSSLNPASEASTEFSRSQVLPTQSLTSRVVPSLAWEKNSLVEDVLLKSLCRIEL